MNGQGLMSCVNAAFVSFGVVLWALLTHSSWLLWTLHRLSAGAQCCLFSGIYPWQGLMQGSHAYPLGLSVCRAMPTPLPPPNRFLSSPLSPFSAGIAVGFYGNGETCDGVNRLTYSLRHANRTVAGVQKLVILRTPNETMTPQQNLCHSHNIGWAHHSQLSYC